MTKPQFLVVYHAEKCHESTIVTIVHQNDKDIGKKIFISLLKWCEVLWRQGSFALLNAEHCVARELPDQDFPEVNFPGTDASCFELLAVSMMNGTTFYFLVS